MRKNNNYDLVDLSPEEIAKKVNRSVQAVYRAAKRLGRLPTVEEFNTYSKNKSHKYKPVDLTLTELSKATGYTNQAIFNIAKKLGRLPSLEELKLHKQTRKLGRPKKYK